MIIGQPGSGKSTLARHLGEITHLPVFYMDHIHWQSGWIERSVKEKVQLVAETHAKPQWIFEGGFSRGWEERLQRADTLIWLDLPLWLRSWRVAKRTLRYWGRTRPDLPSGCPEQVSFEFYQWIWNTRKTARAKCKATLENAPLEKSTFHLRNPREVRQFLIQIKRALDAGDLGLPHRP